MSNLEQHIITHWSHLKKHPMYVACSGGLDSMVLVAILKNLKFDVRVLHVNYHLRGADSNADEAFVHAYCEKNSIAFHALNSDLAERLKDGGNLQEMARDDRYAWFQQILDADQRNYVALAHHSDDQAELFFLNLARKSGMVGLACMPAERNRIIRPLLSFTKAALKLYAEKHDIHWREDVSNAQSKYNRNKLRNVILPELRNALPDLNESIATLIAVFQDNHTTLKEQMSVHATNIIKTGHFPTAIANQLNDFEWIELFRQLQQPASIALAVRALNLKGTKVALMGSDTPFQAVYFDSTQYTFVSDSAPSLPVLKIDEIERLPKTFSKDVVFLNPEKLVGDLQLRRWQIGDRIAPIGLNGTKLISDIISDAKLNALEKQHVLILHDDETIHWCVGLSVGRKAIATTAPAIRVSVTLLESPQ